MINKKNIPTENFERIDYFMTLVLIFYYVVPRFLKNLWLVLASLIFFAWGGVGYSVLLLVSIFCNYFFGIFIGNNLGKPSAKVYLTFGVIFNLLLLGTFKYADFIVKNLNLLLHISGTPSLPLPGLVLPIGISFYTFHSLSYLVDIYRRNADVQRKPVDLILYISFFPQLIAGPIVRYHDIADQLGKRSHTLDKFIYGVERFIIGLAKKVLLANSFGLFADKVFSSDLTHLSAINAWLGIISYTFKIYFDFSGYSDMAIGLARMLGFQLPENFNFPYLSKSIKEFWRRWHISLSSWFRDYVYFPLGGNRINNLRTYINLVTIFFLTGFWHGASWTFIVWGLYQGFFLVIERLGFEKILEKLPKFIATFYALIVTIMGFVLFRSDSFGNAAIYYKALFNFNFPLSELAFFKMNVKNDLWILLVIAILGSFGLLMKFQNSLASAVLKVPSYLRVGYELCYVFFLIGLLAMSTAYLLAGTYNPFIYYRF